MRQVPRHQWILFAPLLQLIVAVCLDAGDGAAQQTPESDTPESETDAVKAENERILKQSRERVAQIAVNVERGNKTDVLEIAPDPVLSFGDQTRGERGGSVWVWGGTGRPLVILELFQRDAQWFYVFNQLAGGHVTAKRNGLRWWAPEEATVRFEQFPDLVPADTAAARGVQMRGISRRFVAHEFWRPGNSRYELRLVSRPLHRYDAADEGIVDGGLFVLANGTNPEVVLLLEARDDGTSRSWWYGLGRLGHAEMHVSLDDREVWTVPRAETYQDSPYWFYSESVQPER